MKKIPWFVGILLILHAPLSADEKSLGSILKNSGESKKFIKASANKKTKSPHFIFDKNGDSNGIGLSQTEKEKYKDKSKHYEYENKPKFNFNFNPGNRQGGMGNGGGGRHH